MQRSFDRRSSDEDRTSVHQGGSADPLPQPDIVDEVQPVIAE